MIVPSTFSDDEILLDIYSPKYPDLQLVDLPGITRTTVDGQDANTVEKILELNMKYMLFGMKDKIDKPDIWQ